MDLLCLIPFKSLFTKNNPPWLSATYWSCPSGMRRFRKQLVTALSFSFLKPTNKLHWYICKHDIKNWCSHASREVQSLLGLQISGCASLPSFPAGEEEAMDKDAWTCLIQHIWSQGQKKEGRDPFNYTNLMCLSGIVWHLATIFTFLSVHVF